MSHRGPLTSVGWIGLAISLTGLTSGTAWAAWSEWMPLDRERGVWARFEESPRASADRVRYQFRNDSDRAAVVSCVVSFYVAEPPTYRRVSEVRLTLFPHRLSDGERFLRGDLVTADCGVSFFDPPPSWAEMASDQTTPTPKGVLHD